MADTTNNNDGWGCCPICGGWDGPAVYFGADAWLWCDAHKLRWACALNMAWDLSLPYGDPIDDPDYAEQRPQAVKVREYRDATDEVFAAETAARHKEMEACKDKPQRRRALFGGSDDLPF